MTASVRSVVAGRVRHALVRLRRAWREGRTDAVTHLAGYQATRQRLLEMGIEVDRSRILEVGCGDRAQLSLLFAADGADVTAIDIRPVHVGVRRPLMWWRLLRDDGASEAARTVARDAFHTVRYWRTLGRLAGQVLPFSRLRPVLADAANLPFADESFDVVISSAVWEHLPDVDAATHEVARVLRRDGIAMIQIALFPSLQGGHHAEWHSVAADPARGVPPWDHLRRPDRPLPVFLNRWREAEYRAVFARHFASVEWADGELRGEPYLAPEIRAELGAYSVRELLLSSITAWTAVPTASGRPESSRTRAPALGRNARGAANTR